MKKFITLSISLLLLLGNTACVQKIFNQPVTLSTKSTAVKDVHRLKKVSAEWCTQMIILFPIVPDSKKVYDELLHNAKGAGGDTVVDFQWRNKSFFMWMFPGIGSNCFEATGTAATFN